MRHILWFIPSRFKGQRFWKSIIAKVLNIFVDDVAEFDGLFIHHMMDIKSELIENVFILVIFKGFKTLVDWSIKNIHTHTYIYQLIIYLL